MSSEAPFDGQLGTTSRRSHMVAADDGTSHPVELLASVNVQTDANLLDSIRSGEAFRVEHPVDGRTVQLALPVVLHDPEKRVFALLLPDSLRHEGLERRAALLAELARESTSLPRYVAEPSVVFSVDAFQALETEEAPTAPTPANDLEASKELARQRAALQTEQEQLEVERKQLDEVRERFDRERARMDEVEAKLQADREKLDADRAELDRTRASLRAEELNLEKKKIDQAQGTDFKPNANDATQVVTDDQFIEVMGEEQPAPADVSAEEFVIDDSAELEAISEGDIENVEVEDVKVTALTDGVPKKFDEVVSGDRDRALKIRGTELLGVYRGKKEDISKLMDGDAPGFFVQLHMVDDYPIIAVSLVRMDDDLQPTASVVWPIDVADASDRMLLGKLEMQTSLKIGLYNADSGSLLRAVDVEAPLERNLEWIRKTAEARLKEAKAAKKTFGDVVQAALEPDFEVLGSMRHNFTVDSFEDAKSPAALKLAIGILGYWSTEEVFEYLIANRSFPIHHFRAVQERVVRRSVEAGLWLPEELRDFAVEELDLAEDEHALAERLIANFAETSVSLRSNDLDPIAQWENWDALLVLGEETGVPADNDVVELAEASLKRAKEFEELQQSGARKASSPNSSSTSISEAPSGMMDDDLIVAKTSEATGITYFLPDDAVLDTFEDVESMDREDLERLLDDPSGRLEAAQALLERFGSEAAEKAVSVADEMNATEVAALARFLETRAKGMEAELVRTVESGGPSSVYVAVRGLAYSRSSTAIPAILGALDDPNRRGDARKLAVAIGPYGEKLVPELRRIIKRDGPNDPWIGLLREVERHAKGTIDAFAKDRSKPLREAAQKAKG